MKKDTIRQFKTIVEFLGVVLGPDYEITLYDLETRSVIAIANGRVKGQTRDNPFSHIAQQLLVERQYEGRNYISNFTSHLYANGKAIRSSVLFIKDAEGHPLGMLGINFDDSRYLTLCDNLLNLIHPQDFAREHGCAEPLPGKTPQRAWEQLGDTGGDTIHNDVSSLMHAIFAQAAQNMEAPVNRLNQEERVLFLARLKESGMFRLRGAVQYIAQKLECSQASVYRYLSKLRAPNDADL